MCSSSRKLSTIIYCGKSCDTPNDTRHAISISQEVVRTGTNPHQKRRLVDRRSALSLVEALKGRELEETSITVNE
jgi:hypothetical protein